MKKAIIKMEKILKRMTVIAGIMFFVLMFPACKNDSESLPEQSEMAIVTINITNNNGRSILPTVPGKLLYYTLKYNENEEHIPSGEINYRFNLPLGIYDFVLTATYLVDNSEKTPLSACLCAELLQKGQVYPLVFNLVPSDEFKDTGGQIELKFKYPNYAEITKVVVKSDKYLFYDTSDDQSMIFDPAPDSSTTSLFSTSGNTTTFTFNPKPGQNDYFLTFEFYRYDEKLRVISEVVKVWGGFTTEKVINVNIYKIYVPEEDFINASTTLIPLSLAQKFDWIMSKDHNCDYVEYIVGVKPGEKITPSTLNFSSSVKKITVKLMDVISSPSPGHGSIGLINTTPKNALFAIGNNVTLILQDDISLTGLGGTGETNENAVVVVNTGGTFIMNNGSITNNDNDYDGGGVKVDGGKFIMNGGTIGADSINQNIAVNGGGVYVVGGTFTMNGGDIIGNEVMKNGGGVYVAANGTFTMNGGSIIGNTARENGSSEGGGGGVYVAANGTFEMNGSNSIIEKNIATGPENGGGGVSVCGGMFTMNNGRIGGVTTEQNYNEAIRGGGVYVAEGKTGTNIIVRGTFTMNGGQIYGNTAGNSSGRGRGGGVFVNNGGTFNMSSGNIQGNTAKSIIPSFENDVYGGGVYVNISGIFIKSGGEITGKSGNNGGLQPNKVVGGTGATLSDVVDHGNAVYVFISDDTPRIFLKRDAYASNSTNLSYNGDGTTTQGPNWE